MKKSDEKKIERIREIIGDKRQEEALYIVQRARELIGFTADVAHQVISSGDDTMKTGFIDALRAKFEADKPSDVDLALTLTNVARVMALSVDEIRSRIATAEGFLDKTGWVLAAENHTFIAGKPIDPDVAKAKAEESGDKFDEDAIFGGLEIDPGNVTAVDLDEALLFEEPLSAEAAKLALMESGVYTDKLTVEPVGVAAALDIEILRNDIGVSEFVTEVLDGISSSLAPQAN